MVKKLTKKQADTLFVKNDRKIFNAYMKERKLEKGRHERAWKTIEKRKQIAENKSFKSIKGRSPGWRVPKRYRI